MAQMAGDGTQLHRRTGRKQEPEQLRAEGTARRIGRKRGLRLGASRRRSLKPPGNGSAEYCVHLEPGGPPSSLHLQREVRFNQHGIKDQRQQRSGVGEREQLPRHAGLLLPRQPQLQQRAGRRKQEEGQSDGLGERPENRGQRVAGGVAQIGLRLNDQQRPRQCEQRGVQRLCSSYGAAPQPVCVEISKQQSGLEEDETRNPNGGRSTERRQQLFGRHRLDSKEEKGPEKNRTTVKDSHRAKVKTTPMERYHGRQVLLAGPARMVWAEFSTQTAGAIFRKLEGMRIGIDVGTTRVVVASVDRGNFPLVNFETPDGQTGDWFPPIVAS